MLVDVRLLPVTFAGGLLGTNENDELNVNYFHQ